MRFGSVFTLVLSLVACATNPSPDRIPAEPIPAEQPNDSDNGSTGNSEQIVKSPQGYVINGPKATFGGFAGDCASDDNFPYYWECQEENAGNDFN